MSDLRKMFGLDKLDELEFEPEMTDMEWALTARMLLPNALRQAIQIRKDSDEPDQPLKILISPMVADLFADDIEFAIRTHPLGVPKTTH